jgi:predicted MFS family arabinose efflux permease
VFAWLLTAHAASGIAATLAVGRLGTAVSPRALIGWSSVAVAAALAVRHNVPSVPLALGLTAVAGVTSVASSVGVETLAQRAVPDEYRGRVFGSLGATLGLLSLLGATAGGTFAETVGIVPMLNVATALIALSGVVVLRSFPRGR